jgi:hypothetical protein
MVNLLAVPFTMEAREAIKPFFCCGKFAIVPGEIRLPNSLPFIMMLLVF